MGDSNPRRLADQIHNSDQSRHKRQNQFDRHESMSRYKSGNQVPSSDQRPPQPPPSSTQEREVQSSGISKDTAIQAVNTIIQLHFEKTLEKKRSIDQQKKELHKQFLIFFIFLGLVFQAQAQSARLRCRHAWIPILLLSLARLIFYVSVAQTLRCINGFTYQRRCHKLTLSLATDALRRLSAADPVAGSVTDKSESHDSKFEEMIFPSRFEPCKILHVAV